MSKRARRGLVFHPGERVPTFMLRCVCGRCGREVFWMLSHTSWFLVQDERVKMPHRCHESWRG